MRNEAFGKPDFKSLFEALPGLYLVLDPELAIVAASDAYLDATLTRRADIVGRHIFDVFPDNPDAPSADRAVPKALASFNRVLQTGKQDIQEVQRHDVRKSASEGGGFEVRYWSPVNSPVLNADGSVAYIIHRVENVTDFMALKQQGAEQAGVTDTLRERAMKMESDLYARSREVAESSRKLKQANAELSALYQKTKELDVLKTHFFANVSHELRTPLTLILGPVERLLSREDLAEKARHDLLVVQRNARLLQRHVNDLLDIAKLEAGRMLLHYARTDLAALTRQTASYFETLAADRRMPFAVQAPARLSAEVDGEAVERMLINLLSNAFKFTPDGCAVSIAIEECAGHALVRVQDEGPGVPENMRAAIFERFQQLDEGSVARRDGGTGLGLAIVREFAALHGGTVEAANAAGGGARFTLRLPLAAPAGTAVAEPPAAAGPGTSLQARDALLPVPPAPETACSPDGHHILVVEDNRDMNAFICETLGRYYRVTRAYDGREGIEKALGEPPDLILSDIMMPTMSGDRMVHELRRHRVLDRVPIVLLTAKADDALRVQLLRQGVQDIIHKPFSMDEVLARIAGLLAERRRTGLVLQESDERYRTLFSSMDEGFCIIEMLFDENRRAVDYRFLETNLAFEKHTGLMDAQGKRVRELVPQLEPRWFELYGRIALTGEPARFRETAEQLRRAFNVHAFRFGPAERHQVAILFTDVTDQAQAEEALRQSERRFRATFEQAAVGIAHVAPDGRSLRVNKKLCDIVAYSREELLLRNFRDLSHPDDVNADRQQVQRMLAGEIDSFGTSRRFLRKDGRPIWVKLTAALVRDEAGAPDYTIAVVEDITAQRAAEAAARESQQLLKSTMDNFPTAIAFKDREGRFLDVNRVVEHVLGVPKQQIVGRTIYEFIPEAAADALRQHDLQVMETRLATQTEKARPLPTGTLTHLDASFPLIDGDGNVYGTGHISHDVTPLKQAETALREMNARLQVADRRKDEFIALLAHELRNPLAPVLTAVELLQRLRVRDPAVERAHAIIGRQVAHMSRLIGDLLDVARIVRGSLALQMDTCDLAGIARETAEDYRAVLESAGLSLVIEDAGEPAWVKGDPVRLAQIIGNYLQNAGKFTQTGGCVTLRTEVDTATRRAVISVRDTGVGIDPALLPRLFDTFTQASQGLARSMGGLGLGLALAKGLAELHGGEVSAYSAGTGQGATFFLGVSLIKKNAPTASEDARPSRIGHLRILLLEDNRDTAEMLRDLLELFGHEVGLAFDGSTGFALARDFEPDVIISDIGLPGELDGYAVARAVRRDPQLCGVRMIALSGYANEEARLRSLECGFDMHLAKPVDWPALEQALARVG
jgi:PAS domain S-box-containing protein